MCKTKIHIGNAGHFVLIWFILFALSPCLVKEALFSTANITYTQPLNKSKTANQLSSCQYSQDYSRQAAASRQLTAHTVLEPCAFFGSQYPEGGISNAGRHYAKTSSGNSPPKYILYKRLKLATA